MNLSQTLTNNIMTLGDATKQDRNRQLNHLIMALDNHNSQ